MLLESPHTPHRGVLSIVGRHLRPAKAGIMSCVAELRERSKTCSRFAFPRISPWQTAKSELFVEARVPALGTHAPRVSLTEEVLPMLMSWLKRMLKKKIRQTGKKSQHYRFVPALECLSECILPSVTASFSPGTGVLSVVGDSL